MDRAVPSSTLHPTDAHRPALRTIRRLALQGGGAHGAFTWGALDRLLQEPDFRIDCISATSSGAMNACALVQGYERAGAAGAREELARFWQAVSRHNTVADAWNAATRHLLLDRLLPNGSSRLLSNPLQPLVQEFFDIEGLQRSRIRLHIATTRVRDGALRLFGNRELSHDVLLASACLPQWFPTVHIDGEAYWDGGFAGNPALEPLLSGLGRRDILCILVQSENHPIPTHARDIAQRITQLGFSSAFLREVRSLHTRTTDVPITRLLSRLRLAPPAPQLHLIRPHDELLSHTDGSAIDTRPEQLERIRDFGTAAAETWLEPVST